jgi:hypothetical protein
MCPTPIGVPVADQEVRIRMRLLSPEGDELGADDLLVVPRCPSGDQFEWCSEICSG